MNTSEYLISMISSYHRFHAGSRVNLALDRNGATCTASEETTPCERAIDGREDPELSSWIAVRDNTSHWIHIDFGVMASIEGVEILQHCGQSERLKKIMLEFGDGNKDTVRAL